jgi:hypothetical protein
MPYRPSLSIGSALSSFRQKACACVDQAVSDSFKAAETDTQGKAGEIERLVYFLTDGVSELQEQLNNLLSPHLFTVTINTIFCHQSPTVDAIPPPLSGKGSELADLVILIRYGDRIVPYLRGL